MRAIPLLPFAPRATTSDQLRMLPRAWHLQPRRTLKLKKKKFAQKKKKFAQKERLRRQRQYKKTLFLAALQIVGRWAKEQVLRHGHVAIGRSKSFGVTRWYYCVLE